MGCSLKLQGGIENSLLLSFNKLMAANVDVADGVMQNQRHVIIMQLLRTEHDYLDSLTLIKV